MPGKQLPKVYPVKFFPTTVRLGTRTYDPDPRGGFRPRDQHHSGSISLTCPYPDCGAPLVWDVSGGYLGISYFKCDKCHRQSSGDAHAKGIRREP